MNIHASLLPRWRGAAPIHAAILAGDAETGITIMQMEAGLDTGPMLLREAVPITPSTTTATLHDTLAILGAQMILTTLTAPPEPVPQPSEGATYAAKLSRDDGRIDWSRDAGSIERQIRAFDPWPGTFSTLDGTVLKILSGSVADGRRRRRAPCSTIGFWWPAGPVRCVWRACNSPAAPRWTPPRSCAATQSPPAPALESDRSVVWALLLEYDGGPFVGWQRQDSGLSVQEVVEAAAARLTGGIPVAATVGGRTDSGVHAAVQVVSLTLPEGFSACQVRDALNFHMKPHPVAVVSAAPAPEGWNPRFSAVHRSYRYLILNRRSRPALLLGRAWHVGAPLDAEAMHAAAQTLLGTHDFTSFRAAACQAKSPVRTLDRLDVSRDGDLITMVVEARSFLHHQVRNFAGTLRLVGDGKWPMERVATVLAARDRSAAGPTAPAEGLCLMRVRYPVDPFGGG